MRTRTTLWVMAAAIAAMVVATPARAQGAKATGNQASPAYDPKDLAGFWVSVEAPFTSAASFGRAVRLMRPDLQNYPETNPRDYPNRHPPLPIRFTPEFEVLRQKYQANHDAGKPYRTGYMCQPNGMLAAVTSNMSFEILAAPGRLVFFRELIGWVFHVHMDRPHKTEFVTPELFGDSVGTWDGDTLVIDSVNLGGHAVIIETEPNSQSLHVVQRIRRPTFGTLVVDIVADDRRAFLEPVRFHLTYRLDNTQRFDEGQCWDDGGGAPMAMAPE